MNNIEKEDENFIVNKRPSNSVWKQQQLPAFQPILTPRLVIIIYLLIGLVFIPLGIVFLTSSDKVIEVRSDNYANFNDANLIITFQNLDMQPPIYLYYQLSDFYQNHRRYVKSRCDEQLRGQYVEPSQCKECSPYDYFNGSGNANQFLFPCGLIVKNVFNDTFLLYNGSNMPVQMTSTDITWSTDIERKFNNPANNTASRGVRTVSDLKNPDFINWMRTSAFPSFRKLYRIIDIPLRGNYSVHVANNFNVSKFGGQKFVILSTTSWLGGKNNFLGITYIIVGAFCLLLSAIFFLKNLIKPRLPGDVQYLEWTN